MSSSSTKIKRTRRDKKNGVGRPTTYLPEYAIRAYYICREFGADDKKLVNYFKETGGPELSSFNINTLNKWKRDHEKFKDHIKAGKQEFDNANVVSALLKRALGYDLDQISTKKVVLKNGKGKNQIRVPAEEITKTTKHIPADVGAICFYLCNRDRDNWKQYKAIEITGNIKSKVASVHMTLDQLKKLNLPKHELERLKHISSEITESELADTPVIGNS